MTKKSVLFHFLLLLIVEICVFLYKHKFIISSRKSINKILGNYNFFEILKMNIERTQRTYDENKMQNSQSFFQKLIAERDGRRQELKDGQKKQKHRSSRKAYKKQCWSSRENIKFIAFMTSFEEFFPAFKKKQGQRKSSSHRFKYMSMFIKTKSQRQCKHKYDSLRDRFQTNDEMIKHLMKMSIIKNNEATQIKEEIIEFLHKTYYKIEGIAFERTIQPLPNVGKLVINPKFLRKEFITVKSHTQNESRLEYIQVQVSLLVKIIISQKSDVFLIQEQRSRSQQNSIQIRKDNLNSLEEANNSSSSESQEGSKQKQKYEALDVDMIEGGKNINQIMDEESNYIHVEQVKTQSKKCRKQAYWTLSEKKLFIFFLALHKDLLCSEDYQIEKTFGKKWPALLAPKKLPATLSNSKKYGDDRKKLIEEEMKKFQINPEIVEQRRLFQQSKRCHQFIVGKSVFRLITADIYHQVDSETYENMLKNQQVGQIIISHPFTISLKKESHESKSIINDSFLMVASSQRESIEYKGQMKDSKKFFFEDQNKQETVHEVIINYQLPECDFIKLKEETAILEEKIQTPRKEQKIQIIWQQKQKIQIFSK